MVLEFNDISPLVVLSADKPSQYSLRTGYILNPIIPADRGVH
jgi:hypothetical protein